mmetsp:Transcript_72605/g.208434  ORF Transcript_72605/g.208434 Transcript_72605/m.208434 type:complete len:260 (+) Transcript_72605:1036-1815(+)
MASPPPASGPARAAEAETASDAEASGPPAPGVPGAGSGPSSSSTSVLSERTSSGSGSESATSRTPAGAWSPSISNSPASASSSASLASVAALDAMSSKRRSRGTSNSEQMAPSCCVYLASVAQSARLFADAVPEAAGSAPKPQRFRSEAATPAAGASSGWAATGACRSRTSATSSRIAAQTACWPKAPPFSQARSFSSSSFASSRQGGTTSTCKSNRRWCLVLGSSAERKPKRSCRCTPVLGSLLKTAKIKPTNSGHIC